MLKAQQPASTKQNKLKQCLAPRCWIATLTTTSAGNIYPLSQVKIAMVRIYLAKETRFLESKTPTQVLEVKENRF